MAYPEYWKAPHHYGVRAEGASVVGVESIPSECIVDIVVNDKARDMLPREFQFLATKEYLASASQCTVPTVQDGQEQRVLVPDSWGRVIPVAYGEIPYEHIVGATVMEKGPFISGNLARNMKLLSEDSSSPWGFFGDKDAQKEIDCSNVLLGYHFRAALPLGYVVFNPDILARLLADRWKGVSGAESLVYRGLVSVGLDNQHPVAFFRLGGVTSRIRSRGKFYTDDGMHKRYEWSRAAQTFLVHEHQFPEHFLAFLASRQDRGATVAALQKIRDRKALPIQDVEYIARLYGGVIASNIAAYKRLIEQSGQSSTGMIFQPGDLANPEDVDLALICQDFESTLVGQSNGETRARYQSDGVEYYIPAMIARSKEMMYSVMHHFVPEKDRAEKGRISVALSEAQFKDAVKRYEGRENFVY